jgi:hypothetical protein
MKLGRVRTGFVELAAVILLLAGGCGGASADDLAEEVAPLVDAHDELRDFQAKVSAGLTYGDVLSDWPTVSARIVRELEDFDLEDHDEANSCDELTYYLAIATAHDDWAAVVSAVGEFIRDDGRESAISDAYDDADISMTVTSRLRDGALEPGDQCEDEEG